MTSAPARRRVVKSFGWAIAAVGMQIPTDQATLPQDNLFAMAAQTENSPPVAELSYSPANPAPEEPVTFDASESSDPDGEIVAYSWATLTSEGNAIEQIGTEEQIEYTFDSAGVHRIGLQVRDNNGAIDQTGRRITVEAGDTQAQRAGTADIQQQRGFFRNTGEDPAWLSNAFNLTLIGFVLSVIGIVQQMIRGR